MIEWIRKLLYDQATFEQYARVCVFLAGEAMVSLGPTAEYYWLGKIVQGLALVLRAGEKNVPLPQLKRELKDATIGPIKTEP